PNSSSCIAGKELTTFSLMVITLATGRAQATARNRSNLGRYGSYSERGGGAGSSEMNCAVREWTTA
ncbi:hypothetical protein SB724_19995, partial [Bacillus sp. SIMBA_031]|uniref:hypothetical protein n=1 Tax=Bacillus sp. SIMBA_031 TaxID=3085774 RepID=UPI00397E390A